MQSTDLGNKESGKIWHRKPSPGTRDGIIVNIIHSTSDYHPKVLRFLNVAFDGSGDSLIAGDHQGNIYVFDLNGNRFNLVQRTAQACTALAFNLRRKSEFLVALADYSIKCFDTVTKELVSWMRGHESSVFGISVHASGRYAMTTSSDTAQLWDLDTFQRKRKLNIRQSVGIQKVFFLPLSNTILSCFKDNSIFAWECDTLLCKYQLPAPPESSSISYKVFAVTRDGRILAAGGKSNHLHLWCLEATQLVRIVQMPTSVRAVRHLEFLPDSFDAGSNQVLGVLSQDGIMRFVNIQTCKLLFEIGSVDEGISSSVVSPHGRYIASIMENGSLNIYSVQALTQEINKPPPPLVKVIEDLPKNRLSSGDLQMKVTAGKVQRPALRPKDSRIQTRILKQDLTGNVENKENELSDGLNKKRLQILLKGYGEYPTKYRMFIWRSLLQLPENHTAFSSLLDKGTHVAFLNLPQKYPIKSRKLLRVLQRTLSALAHWSAIFSDTPYLPLLAFPFVKLFQNNQLICFEVIATLIINWCQHWFEYFPNPPINILSMIENVLAFHDKELLKHFTDHSVTSQLYAWPLLETLFSEVLTREEWLKLFDNVFSNHPSFLLMTVVAYNICSRAPLLNCNLKDDFETVEDMQAEVDQQRVDDEAWYHKQELLRKAEEARRQILLHEEEKMLQQRQKLAAVKRELKMKEIHLQDAARRRFLKLQQDQREMELKRLDDEIERKVQMRDQEIASTAKDLEMRQLELESQRRLYEKNLTRSQEAVAKDLREDADAYRRRVDLEENLLHKLIENDRQQSQKAQQWKEAEEKEFYLRSERKAAALSDASRRWFLEQQISAAAEHSETPSHGDMSGWRDDQGDLSSLPRTSQLNDISETDSSTQIPFSRKLAEWDSTDQNLMQKVRNLRWRLAAQARSRCQASRLVAT
ncbi:TBC1 domain family member 31 isoform X7 [Ochotona curzoniae]|uniref:TBC1 domain family member 31 isoform X7 n=1 Tax=Ochotona curzoniae TaxID=130825 RepID=UPI001B34D077|nr:TBC1 domain family member 31 isoform X7 [Ochotona curzoniae]